MKTLGTGRSFHSVSIGFMLLVAGAFPASAQPAPDGASSDPFRHLNCFMIMAGKDATADGSVMVAHNNDLTGAEASLVDKTPAADHKDDEVIEFPSGLTIPQAKHTYSMMVLRIHTGYAEGDAIAINEHQVSIGGGVALGIDQNARAAKADPLMKHGVTGGIRYTALERCKTARECVEWIGRMYTQHGVTYPSGVAVADPNEIWYIEAGGGHSWAAVRIPDDAVWVQANGYRIGEIDFSDPANYLSSPGLHDFAEEHDLWDPAQGAFHFARAFGRKIAAADTEFSNTRRVWRGISLLDGDLNLDPNRHGLPTLVAPAEKLTVPGLIAILRDHYQGTSYDVYRTNGTGLREYPIATSRTVHTDVVQLRSWLPADIGAVMWLGLSTAPSTMYIPFYFGINEVPAAYATGGSHFDSDSAFWVFRSLSNLVTPYYPQLIDDVQAVSAEFEHREFSTQSDFERRAMELHQSAPSEAKRYLTQYVQDQCTTSVNLARELTKALHSKIAEHAHEW